MDKLENYTKDELNDKCAVQLPDLKISSTDNKPKVLKAIREELKKVGMTEWEFLNEGKAVEKTVEVTYVGIFQALATQHGRFTKGVPVQVREAVTKELKATNPGEFKYK